MPGSVDAVQADAGDDGRGSEPCCGHGGGHEADDQQANSLGHLWLLRQSGNAATTTAVADVEGAESWRDYRLLVRLRTDVAGTIGALVRQSPSGYYLVRLDAATGRGQLVRVATPDGAETVLWDGTAIGVTPGHDHMLTVDCVGAQLTGWLDAHPLFTVHDDVLPAGTVGLRAEANPGARFTEVQVGPPHWVLYHELTDERPSPAGTCLRVHAGSPDQPPTRVPNVAPRFAASPGELGRATIGPSDARLRVVDPDAHPTHERTVRPPAAFTEIPTHDLRLLRRADGTAFYLHLASGPLLPGRYRLTLVYRRDNRTTDPNAPVLSQATETAAESAVLDLHVP